MLMGKVIGIINLFSGNHYLCSSIIFSIICSIGIWQIFKTAASLYPSLIKFFAIGILYYPTVAIWSSGILKDPLTILAIGLIFRATYLICKKRRIILPLISVVLSIYICLGLKPYVLYTFIPSMLLWAYGLISEQIKKPPLKYLTSPIIIILFSFGLYFLTYQISKEAGKYSLENMETSVKGFHSWHQYLANTRDQSGYTLGEIEYTPSGILKKAPAAIFVTFFRPMPLLDTQNASTLFEGIQSFILLIITIWVFLRVGLRRAFALLLFNTHLRAFMTFALLFGFAVGFTSYNFGALSRYKIPALPFFTISLSILYYEYLSKKNSVGSGQTSFSKEKKKVLPKGS